MEVTADCPAEFDTDRTLTRNASFSESGSLAESIEVVRPVTAGKGVKGIKRTSGFHHPRSKLAECAVNLSMPSATDSETDRLPVRTVSLVMEVDDPPLEQDSKPDNHSPDLSKQHLTQTVHDDTDMPTFLLLLDASSAPLFFSPVIPTCLENVISKSTYSARISELNSVLLSQNSLADYFPVYRAISIISLASITAALAAVISLAIISFSWTSWTFWAYFGVILGFTAFVIGIVVVRWLFRVNGLEYIEDLRSILHRYTLIDAHLGLIWQLHVLPATEYIDVEKTLFHRDHLRRLHQLGFGDPNDFHLLTDAATRTVSLWPRKYIVWFSVDKCDFELVLDRSAAAGGGAASGRSSFLIRPPTARSGTAADADAVFSGRRHDSWWSATVVENNESLADEVEGEWLVDRSSDFEFVRAWAESVNGNGVQPGYDARPCSFVAESFLGSDAGFTGILCVD